MSLKYYLPILLFLVACNPQTTDLTHSSEPQPLPTAEALRTIAFGSCNRQNRPQDIWPTIGQQQPQLWIWLGDNIYANTENMNKMEQLYQRQKQEANYSAFIAKTPVIGIWDDHDYGVNDGGKEYPKKDESKSLMLDFLDVPADAPVRNRPGAYQTYTFGPVGKRTKIILLDARSFRDPTIDDPSGQTRYLPNPDGDVLGEAQWNWLAQELNSSDAQLHLIGSGIQIIPEEQGYEKWANFPAARQRLFDLINSAGSVPTILLSGDRHIAELSKLTLPGLDRPVYEVTASGLTHTWSGNFGGEPNQYRVGELVIARNFGLLRIDWSGPSPTVSVEIRGVGNEVLLQEDLN